MQRRIVPGSATEALLQQQRAFDEAPAQGVPQQRPFEAHQPLTRATDGTVHHGKARRSVQELPSFFKQPLSALPPWVKILGWATLIVAGLALIAGAIDASVENTLYGECSHHPDNVAGDPASARCNRIEKFDKGFAYVVAVLMAMVGAGSAVFGMYQTMGARILFVTGGGAMVTGAVLAGLAQAKRHRMLETCGRKETYTTQGCQDQHRSAYWMLRTAGEVVLRAFLVILAALFLMFLQV